MWVVYLLHKVSRIVLTDPQRLFLPSSGSIALPQSHKNLLKKENSELQDHRLSHTCVYTQTNTWAHAQVHKWHEITKPEVQTVSLYLNHSLDVLSQISCSNWTVMANALRHIYSKGETYGYLGLSWSPWSHISKFWNLRNGIILGDHFVRPPVFKLWVLESLRVCSGGRRPETDQTLSFQPRFR